MWIFLPFGFFSVVGHRDIDGALMVRARVRDHLVRLSAFARRHGVEIALSQVIETPNADYRWRVILTGEDFERVMVAALHATAGVDNFKRAASRELGYRDSYVDALHSVWSRMFALQGGDQTPW